VTTASVRPDRVLLLALGTEVRDRAVDLIACRLREAGYEVVVGTGAEMRALVEGIAPDERVVVGLSVGARGAHGEGDLAVALELLRARRGVLRVFAGGRLDADRSAHLASEHDVHVFPLDVTTREIVAWLVSEAPSRSDRS
jgi:methylmalonyl-CoA mutase cobalamin-binding subunit